MLALKNETRITTTAQQEKNYQPTFLSPDGNIEKTFWIAIFCHSSKELFRKGIKFFQKFSHTRWDPIFPLRSTF